MAPVSNYHSLAAEAADETHSLSPSNLSACRCSQTFDEREMNSQSCQSRAAILFFCLTSAGAIRNATSGWMRPRKKHKRDTLWRWAVQFIITIHLHVSAKSLSTEWRLLRGEFVHRHSAFSEWHWFFLCLDEPLTFYVCRQKSYLFTALSQHNILWIPERSLVKKFQSKDKLFFKILFMPPFIIFCL
jgi:hypothetical protein